MENLTIFLADDDTDDRMLFTEALVELPFDLKVQTFDNGVDLMSSLLDDNLSLPDVIFLDLNMPLMNGEECLEDIRREAKLVQIPIIIYSGFLDRNQVVMLKGKGANHYLQKPSNFKDLVALLHRAVTLIKSSNGNGDFIIT